MTATDHSSLPALLPHSPVRKALPIRPWKYIRIKRPVKFCCLFLAHRRQRPIHLFLEGFFYQLDKLDGALKNARYGSPTVASSFIWPMRSIASSWRSATASFSSFKKFPIFHVQIFPSFCHRQILLSNHARRKGSYRRSIGPAFQASHA